MNLDKPSDCPSGKRRHETPVTAQQQLNSLMTRRKEAPGGEWDRPGLRLTVYPCGACGGYHVGNQRRFK